MKPKDIIDALKKGRMGQGGRLTLSRPITNIPVGDSDYQAAKVMEFILKEVLPEKATLNDVLVLLAETQWWLVFFASLQNEKAFEDISGSNIASTPTAAGGLAPGDNSESGGG